jgi:hypothetical protein
MTTQTNCPVDSIGIETGATKPSIFARLGDHFSVSELLRIFGACAMLASMSLFMLNGWSEGNDIQRYLKLLAQTGLLTVGGLILSFALKEQKGARLFFGLSLISVTANFTILGALVYSMVQWDGALQVYPDALRWQAVNPAVFWPVFGGALVALSVLSRFSFTIFARRHAGQLTVLFLLLCAALLLPVRDSIWVSLLIGGTAVAAMTTVLRIWKSESFVSTFEARFALATLFIPSAILLGRAISLYHVDAVLAILMSGLVIGALRAQSLSQPVRTAEHLSGMQRISTLIQFTLGVNIALQVGNLMPGLSQPLTHACMTVAMLGLTAEVVFSERHKQARQSYLTWSMSLMLLFSLPASVLSNLIAYKFVGLATAIACAGLLHLVKHELQVQVPRLMALASVLIHGGMLVLQVLDTLNLNDWVLLGLAGGALIIAASLFERYGAKWFKGAPNLN